MKKLAHLLPALAVAAAACGDTTTTPHVPLQLAASAAHGPGGEATYEITITNLTTGQPLTPPLAATHRPAIRMFTPGAPASEGLRQIAENGNLDPMIAALDGSSQVEDWTVALSDPPPILPGGSVTFELTAAAGAQKLSFVSMLICTNDGFTGLNAVTLPQSVGRSVTMTTDAYDAGTEINTEDFADMVPPCQAIIGVTSDDEGTGMSDPALAEGGVVHHHEGIVGGEDLLPEVHGWTDPVAEVTITRIG